MVILRILRKQLLICVGLLFLLQAGFLSGAILPGYHQLDAPIEQGARLPSNSIIDIKPHGGSLWLGTGRGLTQLHLNGTSVIGGIAVIDQADGIGEGGISALAVTDDIIWASTAYSENTDFGWKPAGGGVGYSEDEGVTWNWMPQPVDDPDEQNYSPTTTHIQNVTYDIALSDSAVWIASFGGGLRKLSFGSSNWEVVTPDSNTFSAFAHYNHRCFSIAFYEGKLVVGTAQGVNVSSNEGASWTNYHHVRYDPTTISGNFVTALGIQETGGDHNIWAATWRAEGATEYWGVSVSENDGRDWRIALSDSTLLSSGEYIIDEYGTLKAHNFGFKGDTVYVAADKGLWRSLDNGYTWGDGPFAESIYDPTLNDTLSGIDFFSVAPVGEALWVGTDDGLAVGYKDPGTGQFTWRIHRAHQPANVGGEVETYAYPSPFSPIRGHTTRFQVPANGSVSVQYSIFNFAMEKVYETRSAVLPGGGTGDMAGYGAVTWDGRDPSGNIVANGVYYYRINVGVDTWWGKVMVLD